MSINLDLGNLWDMLSAIGTVGAVIFSLWLVRKDNKAVIRLMIGSRIKVNGDSRLITESNLDKVIQVSAYNAGSITVGISFIGFGVGIKKVPFLKRLRTKNKEEVTTHVEYMDTILETPKLELIGPGQATEFHEIEWSYLYNTARKYADLDGTLVVNAEFEDFNGKRYVQKIIMEKPAIE